ncbi:MAG: roadblock/LC7 domain-containing protein [Planctomycetes bacterium]|nr:roadblock/LC7 domain-containing protein [Planctomycetota bacterium]
MSSAEIEACALISEDSLMIASALPQHIDEAAVSGITATLHSLGTRAAAELERGSMDQVLVHGEGGYVIMCNAAEGTLLMVMTNSDAKLGLVFLDMKRAVQHIQKII